MPLAEKPPIIVKEGVPDWLVTFGDMMSLLLTFFILLFSVSEIREQSKIYDLVVTFQGKLVTRKPVYGYLLPRLELSPDGMMEHVEEQAGGEMGEAGVTTKKPPRSEGDEAHILTVQDDLYLRLGGDVYFDEGEAFLLDKGRKVLGDLVQNALGSGRFRVVVLGYAAPGEAVGEDDEYLLGYRRARGIRDYLVQLGIPEAAIEVQSGGARLQRGHPAADAESRAQARRVQILVSPRTVAVDPR